tara:strand:+ start:12257 stop:12562 length:306 start_codon:yes stop_codon:yes gene_type:complete
MTGMAVSKSVITVGAKDGMGKRLPFSLISNNPKHSSKPDISYYGDLMGTVLKGSRLNSWVHGHSQGTSISTALITGAIARTGQLPASNHGAILNSLRSQGL